MKFAEVAARVTYAVLLLVSACSSSFIMPAFNASIVRTPPARTLIVIMEQSETSGMSGECSWHIV